MNWIDWLVIGIFLATIMTVGLSLAKRAGKSTKDYFLAGRKIPWWLASFSMIATNFGSDTPLHTAGNARTGGISNFWFYLRGVFAELSIAFFFAKLWRRAEISTEVEFIELRHGSTSAKILRSVLASYNCFLFAPFKIGLFTLALCDITKVVTNMPDTFSFLGIVLSSKICLSVGLLVFALSYSATSGLWGVIVTDFIEMIIAFAGIYVLMIYSYKAVGGPTAMVATLQNMAAEGKLPNGFTALVPANWWKSIGLLLLLSPLYWFSDGEPAIVQRMMSCRSEKDAMLSQLVKTSINLAIRSWPWMICGIASIIIITQIDDANLAYPALIKKLMPHGFIGLMVASFLAAFVSSAASYLNLGSSFFMNDIYKRLLVKDKSEHHYVRASRLTTVGLAMAGFFVAIFSNNVFELFAFLVKILAGIHVVRVMRWFWWRINGPAESAAIIMALVSSSVFTIWAKMFEAGTVTLATPAKFIIDKIGSANEVFSYNIFYWTIEYTLVTFIVTISWIVVMFLTKPDPEESLKRFYRRVRPGGPGWKHIAKLCPEVKVTDSILADLLDWAVGIIFVFSIIFAIGGAFLAKWKVASISTFVGLASGVLLWNLVLPRYDRIAQLDKQMADESK
ncbi:MAG: hypothetical protein PHF37_09750 [Phycisphaerae bacterium]|nr:hypothetical protein [Phycisphaerae bacterium]